MEDTQPAVGIPYLSFRVWLDRICTKHAITEHALARAYAGPKTPADSLPKKQMRGYRRGTTRPSYSSAYRIGLALRALGVRDVSGPVALYAAGHYDRLIAFFAALSQVKSGDWKVGSGSQHVARLYCTVWSTNFDPAALDRAKLDSESKRDLLRDVDFAAAHLMIHDGYATTELFDAAWARTTDAARFAEDANEQRFLETAEVVARAERDAELPPDATWRLIEQWVTSKAPRDFARYRAHLGTHARIDAEARYPTRPMPPSADTPSKKGRSK